MQRIITNCIEKWFNDQLKRRAISLEDLPKEGTLEIAFGITPPGEVITFPEGVELKKGLTNPYTIFCASGVIGCNVLLKSKGGRVTARVKQNTLIA